MAEEPQAMELELAANLGALEQVAAFIEEGCAKLGASPKVQHAFELAADEAVTNVVNYAYPEGEEGWVRLTMAREGDELVLTISDGGRPFDESAANPPDLESSLEERTVGGLGLYFMHIMMDKVERGRRLGRNHLILTKTLE